MVYTFTWLFIESIKFYCGVVAPLAAAKGKNVAVICVCFYLLLSFFKFILLITTPLSFSLDLHDKAFTSLDHTALEYVVLEIVYAGIQSKPPSSNADGVQPAIDGSIDVQIIDPAE
jgi:hypothetical protein